MQVTPHKNHLAAIHIAHKALGLSKDDALHLKMHVVGVASAGNMTEQQRKRYLAHLSSLQADMAKAKGLKPAYVPKRPALHHTIDDTQDVRWGKARALWAALARAGHVTHDTDAALTAYVLRQTKVSAWRFLNGHQVNGVIEALKRWCLRVGVEVKA